jgi:hypothetical protein
MWATSRLVLMCYAHGYGKSGNCPTLGYITLCHYTWRWLLTLDSKVWARRLCLLVVDNTNYFGCDYKTCYYTCAKGITLWSVIVGGPRWLNMERPCAQLCTMSSSQCGWPNGPILSHSSNWPIMYVVWQALGITTMLICDKCFQGWHVGCFMPPMEEVPIGKWFCSRLI